MPLSLCSKESNLLPIELDAVWAAELVLIFWTRKKSLQPGFEARILYPFD
jgi:hypothetical protein